MLVLSRKCGEVIVIADNIRVVVVGVHGGRVKLGFSAPKEMSIHREEIHAQITRGGQVDSYATAEVA